MTADQQLRTVAFMIVWDPTRPKWEQIAAILRARIESGEYAPNERLSEVKLEGEFGVARITVRKAIRALRDEGLVVTTRGMGSFVVPQGSQDS